MVLVSYVAISVGEPTRATINAMNLMFGPIHLVQTHSRISCIFCHPCSEVLQSIDVDAELVLSEAIYSATIDPPH